MSRSPNIYVSNGTCYSAPGKKSDNVFAPCGNDFFGHVTCCQLGDFCLSSHACFNNQFGTTYLAGCSDPDYADSSCPDKGAFDDQPWTGLVYCNGTSEQWVACEQSRSPTTLIDPDPCWCPETSRIVAFTDSSILAQVASLPQTHGGSLDWRPGHIPTPPPNNPAPTSDPTASSSLSSFRSTTISLSTGTPAPTEIPSENADESSGLSQSAKIGVAVGASLGAIILIATLVFLFLAHRRRVRNQPMEEIDDEPKYQIPGSPNDMHGGGAPHNTSIISELQSQGNTVRPWSVRSELQTSDTPLSAVERDSLRSSRMSDMSHWSGQHSPKGGMPLHALTPVAELPG